MRCQIRAALTLALSKTDQEALVIHCLIILKTIATVDTFLMSLFFNFLEMYAYCKAL